MKKLICIQYFPLKTFNIGFLPLWYWQAKTHERKEGFFIYGFEFNFIGISVTVAMRYFKKELRFNKIYYTKNIELKTNY